MRQIRILLKSTKSIIALCAMLILLVVYNEWLVYYIVLTECRWPSLDRNTDNNLSTSEPLYVMILADTHLLGSRDGHWFDKLRREWQMERAFQSSMMIQNPDVVFVLGDLLDEGNWCDDTEFKYHVSRFKKMFKVSPKTRLHVVAGNHDVGFHYKIDENRLERFKKAFKAPSVRMITIKNNIFILLNSMAFEGDRCKMCSEAERSFKQIVETLDCAQGKIKQCTMEKIQYTKPVIFQHFPMFRSSDINCSGPDSAPEDEKRKIFQPKMDCLSKDATQQILEQLNPRLIMNGHVHHFCHTLHMDVIPEWTLSSFSWRNKNNPSFILLTINNSTYAIEKCYLPQESTIVRTYIVGTIILIFGFCYYHIRRYTRRNHRSD